MNFVYFVIGLIMGFLIARGFYLRWMRQIAKTSLELKALIEDIVKGVKKDDH